MKKRLMLALMLLLCAMLLVSCGEKQKFNVLTSQNRGQQQTQQNLGAQTVPQNQEDNYDPLAEEDSWEPADLPDQPVVTATPAPTVRSEYAGATPVVIDPIDKPTPTAVPKLAVSYVGYDAKTLGLSFEGPAGWTTDADTAGTFILQNPNARMDYAATLTLRAEKVAADYDTSALKSVVNGMLDAIGASVAWESYDPSQNAGRTLLGKDGIYANYSGILATGEHVAGRVHAVCVGKMLYTIHLTAPQSQWNDYKDMVYDKVRDTLTIVK